jgi:hypothetical protein
MDLTAAKRRTFPPFAAVPLNFQGKNATYLLG